MAQKWKENYIVPIHKSGDTEDTNNYRGIAVSSCLSKLLTKILDKRLQKYMTVNEKWQPNQCGFMTKHSTEDKIFVINSIYQKYVKIKSTKIFLAFVDLKTLFDCIIREHLLSKLLQNGIGGRFYQVIKICMMALNSR